MGFSITRGHVPSDTSYCIQGTAKKRYARRVRSPSRRICMGCQDKTHLLDVAIRLMKLNATSTAEMEFFTCGEVGSKHTKVPTIFSGHKCWLGISWPSEMALKAPPWNWKKLVTMCFDMFLPDAFLEGIGLRSGELIFHTVKE